MPFSSLKDPVDIARAHAAVEAAWEKVKACRDLLIEGEEAARTRLAYIVAHLVMTTLDEDELVERAVARFNERAHSEPRASIDV